MNTVFEYEGRTVEVTVSPYRERRPQKVAFRVLCGPAFTDAQCDHIVARVTAELESTGATIKRVRVRNT